MIRAPHHQATVEQVKAHPIILAVQDTTVLNYTTHPCTQGLGPICHTSRNLGLLLHSTLAITPAGQPLGFLHNAVRARSRHARVTSRERRPLADKESYKWIESLTACQAVAPLCPDTMLVNITDREGDLCARLPDGERPEDVEIARHVHHCARMARTPAGRVPPLLLRLAPRPGRRGLRPQPRRVRGQGQLRSRRQAGQHRSRCAGFITRGSAGRLADSLPEPELQASFVAAADSIAEAYQGRDLARVVREVMQLADRANLFIDQQKPWLMAKDPARAAEVQGVCTQGLNLFRLLALYLKPIVPKLAAGADRFLGLPEQAWPDAGKPLLGCSIGNYEPLATRVDPAALSALLGASAESLKPTGIPTAAATATAPAASTNKLVL